MADEAESLSAHLSRPLTLIAESDLNDTRLVTRREGGGYGLDAQWSDDFHHAVHVALTGETDGYYADFAPLGALAKVLNRASSTTAPTRSFRGREHGRPIDTDPMPDLAAGGVRAEPRPDRQPRHGRPAAEHLDPSRLAMRSAADPRRAVHADALQGEEWAASTPFAFFTSHPEPELAKATAEGRLAEFERMGWDPDQVLDPQDPATYSASNLRWEESAVGHHAQVLEGYRRLAALRRQHPELTDPSFGRATADEAGPRLTLERGRLAIHLNLGEEEWTVAASEVLFSTIDAVPSGAVAGSVRVPAGGALLVVS